MRPSLLWMVVRSWIASPAILVLGFVWAFVVALDILLQGLFTGIAWFITWGDL